MLNVYESVDANIRKSWLVIAGFVVFVAISIYFLAGALGYFYGYQFSGLSLAGFAMLISGITGFASYYYSDQIILSISNARQVEKRSFFQFYTVTENLCMVARIPMPRLYVIEDTAMNAFATGRDPRHAVICATTGLLANLNRTELEGVIGHELSHVSNYDTRLMSLVTVLLGLITLLADWLLRASFFGRSGSDRDNDRGSFGPVLLIAGLLLALLSPIIAQLIQLAISRRREFLADANSVKFTRQPGGLISALKKIALDKEPLEAANKATAHLYISNPLKNHQDSIGWFAGLFNTHPPVEDRIKILQQMA
jgi:heat shock protein HtpX